MSTGEPADPAAGLLREAELPVSGLYRRHREHNLSAIAAAIAGSYQDTGPVRLGPSRGLAVIAVDGLGYSRAAATLHPDILMPLTSEFPTTTIACLLTSVTGRPTHAHGFIGVQYLHSDGLRTVNCHDGRLIAPAGQAPGAGPVAPARPTVTPDLPTVFDTLGSAGVRTTVLPNELASLHADIRGRLLHGAETIGPALPTAAAADPLSLVAAFGDQVSAAVTAAPGSLTWAYLDLDSHVHRHGFDESLHAADAGLEQLAQRLRASGVTVLLFSDHGLTQNQPSAGTLAAWQEAADERWCRLPPGGAGRTRWLYPHPRYEDRLARLLADRIGDAVVTSSAELAAWGLAEPESTGLRRLGEVILLATGPDFPAPDATTRYEHGSMTADEVLVPMAIWSASS